MNIGAPSYPLSQVANQIKRSVMRDLIALADRPNFVSFAGGCRQPITCR
jgi:hypothetical protein